MKNPEGSCIDAFFDFAEAATSKANELGLENLPLVLAFTAPFDEGSPALHELVHRAAKARLQLLWDQHISLSPTQLSSVYTPVSHGLSWPAVARSMGETTHR